MSMNELHAIVKELKEFKLLKEEAEARIAELETIIKDTMKSQEKDKLEIGEYKCSLATITSSRVDGKALKEQFPDVFSRFSKSSSYERLTVR